MSTAWEKFQQIIREEMLKVYSEAVVEHANNPRNLGGLEDADGYAKYTGPCGDTMSIWLKVADNIIIQTAFTTDGCGTTIASGSMLTEMAKGKTAAQAMQISQQDVLKALGGLPEESQHCALLAANALKEAVKDYLKFKNDPWKKAYRKL
jgi:nitrogen fixation protein NifU and related proteins